MSHQSGRSTRCLRILPNLTRSRVGADELPGNPEIDVSLLYIARQFGDKGSRKSHLDRFIELAARAAAEGALEEDQHYTVVNQGTPDEELALKLTRTFDAVSKYARDYALDGEDMLNTSSDYRDRIKEAADKSGSYVNSESKNSRPLNRCVRIGTRAAAEQLDFDPSSFGANPRVDDGASATAADGGSDTVEGRDGGPDGTPTQRVKEALRNDYGPGANVNVANVAGALGMDPSTARDALDTVAAEDALLKSTQDGYRRI